MKILDLKEQMRSDSMLQKIMKIIDKQMKNLEKSVLPKRTRMELVQDHSS